MKVYEICKRGIFQKINQFSLTICESISCVLHVYLIHALNDSGIFVREYMYRCKSFVKCGKMIKVHILYT